ncbi:MAG TPA: hypothetical protein QGF05_08035 [Dehalococcoidia bacterium]|nr:hypothetical protein [Dehalococcoidia bacterium]
MAETLDDSTWYHDWGTIRKVATESSNPDITPKRSFRIDEPIYGKTPQ